MYWPKFIASLDKCQRCGKVDATNNGGTITVWCDCDLVSFVSQNHEELVENWNFRVSMHEPYGLKENK